MGFLEMFSAPKHSPGGSEKPHFRAFKLSEAPHSPGGSEKPHFRAFKLSEALSCSGQQENLHDASRRVHRGRGEDDVEWTGDLPTCILPSSEEEDVLRFATAWRRLRS